MLGEHRQEADPSDGHAVFSPRTWRVVDLSTKLALIAGGLGWGHMPEHLVRDELRKGSLVELDLEAWGQRPPRRSLLLVWRKGVVMGPVARWAEQRLVHLCRRAIEPEQQSITRRDELPSSGCPFPSRVALFRLGAMETVETINQTAAKGTLEVRSVEAVHRSTDVSLGRERVLRVDLLPQRAPPSRAGQPLRADGLRPPQRVPPHSARQARRRVAPSPRLRDRDARLGG